MKINKINLSLQILAFIGLALSVELAFIYYNANYDKYALSSFCSVNDFIDCDGVAKTNYSQFLGIPLAYWGIFFYVTVLFLSFVNKLKEIKFLKFLNVFKSPTAYINILATFAFCISIILACISIFSIKKICVLCFVTYFIDLLIALIASECTFGNFINNIKKTISDFMEGFKKYPKTAITLLLITISFLAYSGITLNFVPKVKRNMEITKYSKIKYNPYRVKGNVLGNANGNVKIKLYSDFVCPLCYINNIMLHQAVREFKNIQVIHYNYPFDKECNKNILINMHPNACFMWKGAIAAKNQGNYWEMSSLLYENHPKNMEEILKLAEKLNFDLDKFKQDMTSKSTIQEMQNEIKLGADLEIDATPTMYINNEKIVGVKPYYELKEILQKHGAKK